MFLRHYSLTVGLLACASLGGVTAATAQTPTHVYNLSGNYNDTLGGVALTGNGGTFDATNNYLVFGANQGPTLNNGINASTYSVEMDVRLDALNGYRKLLDFQSLGSDNGLYDLNGSLTYYLGGALPTAGTSTFTTTDFADVVLTRDNATQLVVGYLNGIQQFSFTDTGADATFSSATQTANFFQDDVHTNGNESSSGTADFIRIYDTALTPAQVAANFNAISGSTAPEPISVLLALPGIALLGIVARRRLASA